MASLNRKTYTPPFETFEGAKAQRLSNENQLRRTVLSCLLWEDGFYENGQTVAKRIETLVATCSPDFVANLAIEARANYNLRHVPLLLVREMVRNKHVLVADTVEKVIQRPDEITEFLSLYQKYP